MLGEIFSKQIHSVLQEIEHLKCKNAKQASEIDSLTKNLKEAQTKIITLESYNRLDNLIISGLPLTNAAEAVATTIDESSAEHILTTELAVYQRTVTSHSPFHQLQSKRYGLFST